MDRAAMDRLIRIFLENEKFRLGYVYPDYYVTVRYRDGTVSRGKISNELAERLKEVMDERGITSWKHAR